MIGAEMVAKAPPDGYTVLMASVAEVAINPSLYARMTYDPLKDLAPVTLAGFTPLILVVHPSVQAWSVKELIGLAKANPGRFTFASPGNGSVQHLSGELMKTVARVDITHVPYKGGAPAVTDLVGGQISMFFAGMPIVMPHVKVGRLRALAVTVNKRSPAAPDVPTMEEAGVPGFDISNWFGVYVPAATPKAVIAKLNSEMSRVLNLADLKERLAEQGLETVGNSVEQFDTFFRAEILKYDKIIRESGARPD
jgi:tripartite-type tricarboxylate transporter receptor subunit TctC